jgi:hypothetical protein
VAFDNGATAIVAPVAEKEGPDQLYVLPPLAVKTVC